MESIIIKTIFETLPVGLLVIDPQGEIIISNESASRILGYPHERILGKGWADLFLEAEENVLFNQVLVDVIWEQTLDLRRIVPYTQPGGEVLQLSVTTSYIKSVRGLEGIAFLLDDISELLKTQLREKEILKEKERIQQERTESLKNLSMAIAHQLRNPTTAIGGLALLMLKRAESESRPGGYLQNILDCVRRLEDIVKSIQEYTTIPAPSPSKTAMSRVLEQVRSHALQKGEKMSRIVDLDVDSEAFDAVVDPVLLVEALNEIVDNAIENSTGDRATLHIKALRNKAGLSMEIADEGIGIPSEDLPYILDPFFTTKAIGVGMGLCKARRIVAEHGGRFWVESTEGRGTRVMLRIPEAFRSLSTTVGGMDMMEMHETLLEEVTILRLKGRLDSASAADFKERIKDSIKKGHVWVLVDMEDVDFVDSSGLGSLVACLRSLKKAGGDLKVAVLQDRVRAVFELIRLHTVFEIFDSTESAVRSFAQ